VACGDATVTLLLLARVSKSVRCPSRATKATSGSSIARLWPTRAGRAADELTREPRLAGALRLVATPASLRVDMVATRAGQDRGAIPC